MGNFPEIIEVKSADGQLRQQAALLDNAQDAILVRDLNHRVTYWNKGAERLYGWTGEEAVGRTVTELLYKGTTAFQQICKQVMQKGEWTGELQQVGKDGRKVIVESRWTLMHDAVGTPQSILTINTDVTERKQTQEALRASEARLKSIFETEPE